MTRKHQVYFKTLHLSCQYVIWRLIIIDLFQRMSPPTYPKCQSNFDKPHQLGLNILGFLATYYTSYMLMGGMYLNHFLGILKPSILLAACQRIAPYVQPIHEHVVLPARPRGGYIPSWFQPGDPTRSTAIANRGCRVC